jgi:hypothetical protein
MILLFRDIDFFFVFSLKVETKWYEHLEAICK